MTITLIEIDGNVQGESVTSVAIGTGTKTFTLDETEPFIKDLPITIKYDASNTMTGTVLSINGTTISIDVTSVTGSGTYAEWTLDAPRTLYFGTSTYISKATDTPALQEYIGDVKDAGDIQQYMFSVATTSGESKVGSGDIIINNNGAWDFIRKMGFNSGALRIKQVENNSSALPTTNMFAGTVLYPDVGDEVNFAVADRLADLDVPAQEAVFDGSNTGATGVEGEATTLKGQIKPFGLGGKIRNATAKLLNQTLLIYGVNFDYVGDPAAVATFHDTFDERLAKSIDTGVGTSGNVANLATLQAATITAGQIITCTSTGMVRFAGSPNGLVTIDFTETSGLSGSDIIKELIERIGMTTDDYDAASFTSVDSDRGYDQELFVNDDSTVLELAQAVAIGFGGYVISNLENKICIGILKAPEDGTSVHTFTQWTMRDFSTLRGKDNGDGVPPKQIKFQHSYNYTTMSDAEFAGAVTDEQKEIYKKEYQEIAGSEDTNVSTKHSKAPIFIFPTHLTSQTDATTELGIQELLRQKERSFFEFTTNDITPLNLGDVVTIEHPRFDLSSGQKMVIMGKELEFANNRLTYLVWG